MYLKLEWNCWRLDKITLKMTTILLYPEKALDVACARNSD